MHRSILLVLIAVIGLPSLAVCAPIYRCAAPGGGTVFSQVPCGDDAAKVAGSTSKQSSAPGADAATDKAALAEIDGRCDAQSRHIVDGYSARFAEANAKIVDLHKSLMVKGANGTEKDPEVQKQIAAVEASKTELLGDQDREISAVREQCQMDRTTELKRQSDRKTARTVAKR
jgi:hypothetical protein